MIRRRRVERRGSSVRVHLSRREIDLLAGLAADLAAALDEDPGRPDLRRVFPPAHEDDPSAEAEYRRLAGDDLIAGRRSAIRTFVDTLSKDRLTDAELDAWLRVVNDLRLVLGTRLDVDEDTFERPIDPRDPLATEHAVYLYLSWLQEQLVAASEP